MANKKQNLPETLVKKMDIAKRICEPLNDKRFQWEEQEDGTFKLSGLQTKLIYRDSRDEKHPKGFSHTSANGKKVYQESTLNVGYFVRSIRAELEEIVAGERVNQQEAQHA